MAFFLKETSSRFFDILTRVQAKSIGKLSGSLLIQAFINLKDCNLSLSTLLLLNSLSIKKLMITWILVSLNNGITFFVYFKIFFKALIQDSLKVLSLSLTNIYYLNFVYKSFLRIAFFIIFLTDFLFSGFESRCFNAYQLASYTF